jgi:hypothetical protein
VLEQVTGAIAADPKRWVDFMMRFELGLKRPDPKRALVSALTDRDILYRRRLNSSCAVYPRSGAAPRSDLFRGLYRNRARAFRGGEGAADGNQHGQIGLSNDAPERHQGLAAHRLQDHRKGILPDRIVGGDVIGRVEEASGSRFAADSPLDAGAAAATPSSPTCGADDILKVADASGEPVNAGDSANLRLIVLIRWVNCPNFLAYCEPRDSVILPSSRGRAAGAAALAGAESSVHAAVSSIPPPARRGNSSRDTTPFLSLSINCKLQKRGRP